MGSFSEIWNKEDFFTFLSAGNQTQWSTTILKEIIVLDAVKKFLFYGPQNLFTVFTKPTTCPYAEPDESSTRHLHPISLKYILILLSNLRQVNQVGSFLEVPKQNPV